MTKLALKHGLAFADLYEREGLIRLDRAFVAHLEDVISEAKLRRRDVARNAGASGILQGGESFVLVDE